MVDLKHSLALVNPRTIKYTGKLSSVSIEENEDEIIGLETESGWKVKLGDTIKVKKNPYKINHIDKVVNKHSAYFLLSTARLNLSSIFAFPFLSEKRSFYLWDLYFINAFIGTCLEDTGEVIALLYRFSGDKKFIDLESHLTHFPTFKKRIDPDPYHVLYIFNPPKACRASYQKLLESKYSEIDDLWKLSILQFHGFEPGGRTGKVLFKSESLKKQLEEDLDVELGDAELHSCLDMNLEVFNPDIYLPAPKIL